MKSDDMSDNDPAPSEDTEGHYADLLNTTVWDSVIEADEERNIQPVQIPEPPNPFAQPPESPRDPPFDQDAPNG